MIYGIGTDIVDITRIQKIFDKYGFDFFNKILSEEEQIELKKLSKAVFYEKLAKLFSVKEAFAKALGTGIRDDICFRQIQILNDSRGAPFIKLKEGTKYYFEDKIKDGKIHLSISHEKNMLISFVIIEQ